jgi:hypothetical protein
MMLVDSSPWASSLLVLVTVLGSTGCGAGTIGGGKYIITALTATETTATPAKPKARWNPDPDKWQRIATEEEKKTLRCKVKSFSLEVGGWNLSTPGRIFKSTTIRLPVNFMLELEEGSTKHDCRITQYMRGETKTATTHKVYSDWEEDAPIGADWWNGDKWEAGGGSWAWFSETATFRDEPGFKSVPIAEYPLYWGGVGRKGHFEFMTMVFDKNSHSLVGVLRWGILIDYSKPNVGHQYFYK